MNFPMNKSINLSNIIQLEKIYNQWLMKGNVWFIVIRIILGMSMELGLPNHHGPIPNWLGDAPLLFSFPETSCIRKLSWGRSDLESPSFLHTVTLLSLNSRLKARLSCRYTRGLLIRLVLPVIRTSTCMMIVRKVCILTRQLLMRESSESEDVWFLTPIFLTPQAEPLFSWVPTPN